MTELPTWLATALAVSNTFWSVVGLLVLVVGAVSILVITVDSLLRPGGSMWGRWR